MLGLGDLAGGAFFSEASGVSGDGAVVVGKSESAAGEEAFIWDKANGMRSLQTVLTRDYGLNLTDWRLVKATGISDDGLIIVGYGTNPDGLLEGWIADLREDPEP